MSASTDNSLRSRSRHRAPKWWLLALLLLPLSAMADSVQDRRTFILNLLQQYSPDSHFIVSSYDQAPFTLGDARYSKTGFLSYISGYNDLRILEDIGTMVHEMNHGYTGHLGEVKEFSYYQKKNIRSTPSGKFYDFYLGQGQSVLVRRTPTFRTNRIVSTFPTNIRTFRFDTYVNSSSTTLSSQSHGVYGLLDELNSYFIGTKVNLDLLPYYWQKNSLPYWKVFFKDIDGSYYGCLEFKLYILKYLQYAREHEPAIYQQIMANGNFHFVFTEIDKKIVPFYQRYLLERKKILENLAAQGYQIKWDGDMLAIYKPTDTRWPYTSTFANTVNLLQNELASEQYRDILQEISKSARLQENVFDLLLVKPDIKIGIRGNQLTITMSSPSTGATIRYSLDGSAPLSEKGKVYNGEILLPIGSFRSPLIIKAITIKAGYTSSSIEERHLSLR